MTRRGAVAEDLLDGGDELALRHREAGHLGVGRVGEEEVDALLAEPGEAAQVGDPPVERELVHLEVAGVQHQAGGGADGHGERVGDRVVDGEELEVERAEGQLVALGHLAGDRLDLVLLQLGVDERQRELGADQRDVAPLAQQVGHAADVVLVAVGQHDRDDVVHPVPDRGEVGEDDVDARLVLLGEEDAAVDDQQLAGVLEDRHVAADLAEPAQRDHAQAALGQGRRRAEFGMGATHTVNVTATRNAKRGPRRQTVVYEPGHQR